MSLVKVCSYLSALDQDGISQRRCEIPSVGSQSLSGVASGHSPGPRDGARGCPGVRGHPNQKDGERKEKVLGKNKKKTKKIVENCEILDTRAGE